MLIVPDARRAAHWYQGALEAEELWDLGSVVGLHIAGAPFFLHEAGSDDPAVTTPGELGVTSTRIELFCDEPEAVLERALAAGATLGSPVHEHDTPWGPHRQGGFRDPFGHHWSVGDRSPIRPPAHVRARPASTA